MIDVKEIRIGNCINNTFELKTLTVSLDLLVKIQRMPQLYKPIPLTEEWLLKFGFKNQALKKYKATFGFYRKKRFTIIWNKDKGFTAEGFKIKYIHQLQNLYAFTGEELTLKTDNNDTGN